MKHIILSYDYELFFGSKSGTVIKTIIGPTNRLLDAMDRVGLKGNFFIDYLMIKKLQSMDEPICKNDLVSLERQLRDIVRRGHRIELHLHPHWLDALYLGNGLWDFSNFSRYSLSAFCVEDINNFFKEGVAYLNKIGSSVQANYNVCAFRAGGWAVQPFTNLKDAFSENNIIIDTSVAYKAFGRQEGSEYNFIGAPSEDSYRFENDVCKKTSDGHFIEVPIHTIKRNILDKSIDKLLRVFTHYFEHYSDGTHARPYKGAESIDTNVHTSKRSMFCLSFLNPISLMLHFTTLFNKNIVCMIDHPKDINPVAIFNIGILGGFYKSINYKDMI